MFYVIYLVNQSLNSPPMTALPTPDGPPSAQLDAEIAQLRAQFPRTADLYREVCVLLFFRYGITPTATSSISW
jgi:hypothetical protein